MNSLKYTDETDRAYGLGGMAVAMVVWESDRYIHMLDIEASADQGLRLTPDFYMIRSPKSSPRATWNDSVEKFQLTAGLIISNILCRALVKDRQEISPQLRQTIVSQLREEGAYVADLTDNEVETIFSKAYNYFHSIFSHPTIAGLCGKLAESVQCERRIYRERILEILAPLQRI